ncbi:mitochondrial amidoxime-reducing component 1 [Brachionus plicatilis]|uniref:Mitochondrial amidoxime-reducing component 1 n=1 Tax=Brachionus plicatilis TaxID=10195 RepID=A0A3M7S0K4_BRAPC|nr:mitochondrial amidoxime-reducing component 1 [Brachionus plicatilis]
MKELATLSEIYLYPVKSLSGIKLEKALTTKYGLAHPENSLVVDRKWMIVDSNGSFRTQRQIPKMALIKPSVEGDFLVFNAPQQNTLKIPIKNPNKNTINCRLWKCRIDGCAYGGEVSSWLSSFLEVDGLDLIIFDEKSTPVKCQDLEESTETRENDVVIYQDFSPFMLIGENSLDELNKRLENKVTMKRFRPNFISKNNSAFSEDDWEKFKIGESEFCRIKHCTRCLLTTVDQNKGERDKNQEPLKTLREFRLNKEVYGTSPMFGINMGIDNPGKMIKVGDKITPE